MCLGKIIIGIEKLICTIFFLFPKEILGPKEEVNKFCVLIQAAGGLA